MIFYKNYDDFKEKKISRRFITQSDIIPLIKKLKKNNIFEINKLGCSIDGKDINLIKIGTGKTSVLLWSQMHGNETTGTAAIFDIFNYFTNNKYRQDYELILNKCTLYFIPMLNPDGAKKCRRTNAIGIDLNRDAVNLTSPESRILINLRDKVNADFALNLHDQEIYYSAGNNPKPALMSFLAPSYNEQKEINSLRKKSMQLINVINKCLQKYIPEQVGRYSDKFISSAFGDNIQKRNTSTILIETGGNIKDKEKQFARKLTSTAIFSALKSIASCSYKLENINDYKKIPLNVKNKFFDIIIRGVKIKRNNQIFKTDIGIRKNEFEGKGEYKITQTGDLSDYYDFNNI